MAAKTPTQKALSRINDAARNSETEINLNGLELEKIPDELFNLSKVKKLDFNHNNLTEIPQELFSMQNLSSLDFSNNKLREIPSEINKLQNLEELYLFGNLLSAIPYEELVGLQKLRLLHLGNNPINFTDFKNNISKLQSIESLYLWGTRLDVFPEEITELSNLRDLILNRNNIASLPPSIGKLRDLRTLAIGHNKLLSIPNEIGLLTFLEILDLSHNNITDLPKEIGNLINLNRFFINANRIVELPPEIGKLRNLEWLFAGNRDAIRKGKRLFFVEDEENKGMLGNKLLHLPKEIVNLKKLKGLDLSGNDISIPPELIEAGKPKEIFKHYFYHVGKLKRLDQAKIIILGQGAVGKTSIVQQILQGIFNQNQTKTDGIEINKWKIRSIERQSPYDQSDSEIQLNIWDFGGQEIMHATHQFFLTKRSLYLLVLDSRLTQEENRVEYWLKIIQSFGGESPVLIVGNKIDQHPLDIDRTGLQKKYPNIVGILETSAATGAGIEELKAAITEQVNNLPHVRDLLPETWFTVKTKLEGLGRESNFITHDKYLDLCAENEVSDETSQRTLIGFLHDLGVVLHFQDDPRLEALGILNPQWVTNGVYKILNSHTLFQNKGVLTTSMLDEILNLPEYPRGKRLFIVDMMKKFELCYDIEPDKTFLVPDLLPKDQPDLKFNGVPAFEYAYPVLPSSVITRFIVRMNQKIDDGLVWRTGVVLKIGENKALVKADIEDRKITIAIDGVEYSRRDALSAIRYELGEIHNSIKGLNPQQRVPVPNAPQAEPLKYEYLLKLERAGQETVLVENGNDLVTVNVRQMLSAIESEAQRREQQGNVINNYYNANNGGIIVGRDLSGNLISGNYNKINSAEIDPELKDTLLQLGEAVDAMIEKLPAEQAADVAEDFGKLAEEAVKPKPNQKWYSVSIEGLIKAAENLDKLGTPVINLSRKVLSLLTGGVVKS